VSFDTTVRQMTEMSQQKNDRMPQWNQTRMAVCFRKKLFQIYPVFLH